MSKKVLIISTSLRKNGNSDILAQSFAKGAVEAGNEVEIVSLADKKIAFCRDVLPARRPEDASLMMTRCRSLRKSRMQRSLSWQLRFTIMR